MTQLINGRGLAQQITDTVRSEIQTLGITPGLGVILVGNDPPSHLYVFLKEKACANVGIRFEKFLLPEQSSEEEIKKIIASLNERDDIHAILIQIPLPAHLDENRLIAAINPAKDVDGFHPATLVALSQDNPPLIPGLVAGILAMIHSVEPMLATKHVVILANSDIFAAPFFPLLKKEHATASWVSPDDIHMIEKISSADILIVAIGRAHFVKGSMIKSGALIIDVGTNRIDNHIVGDVDATSVDGIAAALSPVPGGVGPMTVAMLLKNTLLIAKKRQTSV